jgi:UDP-N-acetylmuramoylalanine--D-glutamate ligase
MKISDLKSKQVAILGFGEKEGKATLEYLLKHNIRPTLFDQRTWDDFSVEDQNYIKEKNIPFVFGEGYLSELRSFEIAFRNPAVKYLTPELQDLIQKGLTVTSQTNFFLENCPAKVIGITGTKGKGTTSSLIYEILQLDKTKIGKKYLTGNIGKTQPFEFLDNLTTNDFVVYELSSFQLQDLKQSPEVAVVLMTTSEHLDYHLNLQEYWDAKKSICNFQEQKDVCIYNSDYEGSKYIGNSGNGQKHFFSTKEAKGDCYVKNNAVVLYNKEILNLNTVKLRGQHNWENICASVLTAKILKCSDEVIAKGIIEFKGLEHRLEFIGEKSGVFFYNDSFSTTPETAIAAIKSFNESLVLILGGSSKNSDFTELSKAINNSKQIKSVILIGTEAETIKKNLTKNSSYILQEGAKSMTEIFEQIKHVAKTGDTVLLSPACASFDMFKNYKDRGEQFKKYSENFNI